MYMFKEVDQPRAEVSPGSLAAAEERVEHRRIFSGIIIATEQVITSAARDRPHFIFYLVIIRSVTTVQMVPGEFVEPFRMYILWLFRSDCLSLLWDIH